MRNLDRRTALCVIATAVPAATGDVPPARAHAARDGLVGLIANARNSFQAQQIVLGHANLPPNDVFG